MAFLFPKACESTSGIGRPFLVVDMIRFSLSVGHPTCLLSDLSADSGISFRPFVRQTCWWIKIR